MSLIVELKSVSGSLDLLQVSALITPERETNEEAKTQGVLMEDMAPNIQLRLGCRATLLKRIDFATTCENILAWFPITNTA